MKRSDSLGKPQGDEADVHERDTLPAPPLEHAVELERDDTPPRVARLTREAFRAPERADETRRVVTEAPLPTRRARRPRTRIHLPPPPPAGHTAPPAPPETLAPRELAGREAPAAHAGAAVRIAASTAGLLVFALAGYLVIGDPPWQGRRELPSAAAAARGPVASGPSERDVAAAFGAVKPALRTCAAGRRGVVRLELTIAGHSGAVTGARVLGGLAQTAEGRCMARAARKARLAPFAQERFRTVYALSL